MNLGTLNVTSSTTHQVIATVPTGYRWVVRTVTMANKSVTAGSCYLFVPEPVEAHRVTLAARSAAGDTSEWDTWLVMGPGQSIASIVGSGLSVDVAVHGSQYFI